MTIVGRNIRMIRGDSESITITVTGQQLQPEDVAELTVRRSPRSPKVLHKVAKANVDSNTFVIGFDPEDTSSLQFGDYVYDVQLNLGGYIKTVIAPATLTIGEEVTYD